MIIDNQNLRNLRTGFKTNFQAGLGQAPDITKPFVTPIPSTTLIETYGFLGDFPIFRKWVGQKRIKSLEERAYQLTNDDFEVTMSIARKKIEDDNLGLYPPMIEGIGQDAGHLNNRLALDALKNGTTGLCYDGLPFFSSAHSIGGTTFSNNDTTNAGNAWYLMDLSKPLKPIIFQDRKKPVFVSNVSMEAANDHLFMTGEYLFGGEARGAAGYSYWQTTYRSTALLTAANYEAAKQAMMSLTDDNGERLGVQPTHIVVGASNIANARALFAVATNANGAGNQYYQELAIINGSLRLA